MHIESRFENCSYDLPCLINEAGDSKVELRIELDEITSLQSRKSKKDTLAREISNELQKYHWQISGPIWIEFHWYLSHQSRHETDKGADLDNIMKPIIDCLTGEKGLLIDDSQVKSLYVEWSSKNEALTSSFLLIWIQFINDYTIKRDRLFFIQYHNAMCTAIDLDKNDLSGLMAVKLFVRAKTRMKKIGMKLPLGSMFYLTYSVFDFHKTRLQKFHKTKIMTIEEFNNICRSRGVNFRYLLREFRKTLGQSKRSIDRKIE